MKMLHNRWNKLPGKFQMKRTDCNFELEVIKILTGTTR